MKPPCFTHQKTLGKTERLRNPHLSVTPQDLAPYVATGCRTSTGLIPPSLLIRYGIVAVYYTTAVEVCQYNLFEILLVVCTNGQKGSMVMALLTVLSRVDPHTPAKTEALVIGMPANAKNAGVKAALSSQPTTMVRAMVTPAPL